MANPRIHKAFLACAFVSAFAAAAASAQTGNRPPTPAQTEGPYFKAGSPERRSLRQAGVAGVPLRLTGKVIDLAGKPVPGARLEFWQADGEGRYDNSGFTLRGHQFADGEGRYLLDTVLPARYLNRASHIHVKVIVGGKPPLTTQLYFAGESGNESDPLVDARLTVVLTDGPEGKAGAFDFTLNF